MRSDLLELLQTALGGTYSFERELGHGAMATIYEMLSGAPPFHGPTPQATLTRRFTDPPRKLRPVVQVPEHMEVAILRALARDPVERFATAGDFAAALSGTSAPVQPRPAH